MKCHTVLVEYQTIFFGVLVNSYLAYELFCVKKTVNYVSRDSDTFYRYLVLLYLVILKKVLNVIVTVLDIIVKILLW